MKKLFRFYELIALYLIGIIYFLVLRFRIDRNSYINNHILFEIAIVLLVFYLIREFAMFIHLLKINAKSIFKYSMKKFLFCLIVVFIYYLFICFSNYEIAEFLIILLGVFLNNTLPRPISQCFHTTNSGYVLNGTYFKYKNIGKLNLAPCGRLDITCNGKEESIVHYIKKQKIAIY